MASFESHPTVLKARSRPVIQPKLPIDADWLKQLALQSGADDAGIVEVERQAISDQRGYIDQVFSGTRALLSYVVRMNREPIRAIARSVANQEFHAVYDEVNLTRRKHCTFYLDPTPKITQRTQPVFPVIFFLSRRV